MTFQRLFLAILLAVTAVLGVASILASISRPYVGISINFDGEISYLDSQGPASQAGIRFSDIIKEIDDQPVNPNQPLYQNLQIGDAIHYLVLRDTDLQNITVITIPVPLYTLANYVVITVLAITFWCIGLGLFVRRNSQYSTSHFIVFVTSTAAALFVLEDAERWQLWARSAMYCALPIGGAAFLNMHKDFPATVHKIWRLICDLSYWSAALLTIVVLAVGPNALTTLASSLGFDAQLPSNLIRLVWVANCLAGLYLLIHAYPTQTGDAKRRTRLVTLGSLVGLIPVAFVLATEAVGFYPIPNTIALSGLLALPVTYSISLTQVDIIRLEARFYRVLIVITFIVLVPLIYLSLISLFVWLSPTMGLNPLTGAMVALGLSLGSTSLYSEVKNVYQWIFFRESPTYFKKLSVITNSLKVLSKQLEEQTVITLLVSRIPAEINIGGVGLWLVEDNSLVWKGGTITDYFDAGIINEFTVLHDKQIVEPRLIQKGDSAGTANIRWWVPLTTSENGKDCEVLGIWLLGARENDESFSFEDIELISAAAQEGAMALKIISSVAQLRYQLKQTEKAWRYTMRIREEEQKRIANDLHDDVIQTVYSCGLSIQKVLQTSTSAESRVQILEDTKKLLDEVSNKTRLICLNLRPDTLMQLDLEGMLQYLMAEVRLRTPLDVSLYVYPVQKQYSERLGLLDQHTKISLYRIVQESLNNITKHAYATHATVSLHVGTEQLSLEIADNGIGFDVNAVAKSHPEGLGLVTIRTRATDINATVSFESDNGVGTRVMVRLPYRQVRDQNMYVELS